MDLTEHYHGIAEDMIRLNKPLDQDIDLAITYGLFPVGTGQGMSTGIMVVMTMRSALLNQHLSGNRVIYGPRPDEAMFREMCKSMVTDLRTGYDDLLNRAITMPGRPPTGQVNGG